MPLTRWQPSRREMLAWSGALTLVEKVVIAKPVDRGASQSVIVQAGRRVDAVNTDTTRFPPANVDIVQERIKASFALNKPLALVTSAACGADLLALRVAEQLNIERFILLPSPPQIFRSSSVTDRPGNWAALFDQAIKTAHLQVLTVPEGQRGYLETNLKLLGAARALAKKRHTTVSAMVVWDLKSRGPDDVTAHFRDQANLRKLPIMEISTV